MGLYLNPNAEAFQMGINSEIYVDKSFMVLELNKLVGGQSNFVCMSRPRRFGKSMAGNLIAAYYSKGCDTRSIFSKMKIGQVENWDKYLNKFNVIKLDLNGWYQRAIQEKMVDRLMAYMQNQLRIGFEKEFPNITFEKGSSLATNVLKVYEETGEKFVIIIDEYDVMVREKVPVALFNDYLSFLNSIFKDATVRPAFALAYITGIIPIVRDKVQSKLNEFKEYTMIKPRQFAGLIGFTEAEVKELCDKYNVDFDECLRWYDGYKIRKDVSICNPLSVVTAIQDDEFDTYWSATGSFEVLKDYILMDFSGMKQDVIRMIAGESVPVNVSKFQNTLQSITNRDNAFTYLIHLGYLSYNSADKTCCIPNREVRQEWVNAIDDEDGFNTVMSIINASKQLLDDTINDNEDAVAKALDAAHTQVTSIQTYNDEHCFQSAICLAYFYANTRYTLIKELPTGKGFADLVMIPHKPNIPAIVVELKHNKSADSAINQIKDKNYCQALSLYHGDLLFVGINYDEKTKVHSCRIERVEML